jgi:hypothetical protein
VDFRAEKNSSRKKNPVSSQQAAKIKLFREPISLEEMSKIREIVLATLNVRQLFTFELLRLVRGRHSRRPVSLAEPAICCSR